MGVFKNTGYPKMDGENNGSNPMSKDDLGVFAPLFLVKNTHINHINILTFWEDSKTLAFHEILVG